LISLPPAALPPPRLWRCLANGAKAGFFAWEFLGQRWKTTGKPENRQTLLIDSMRLWENDGESRKFNIEVFHRSHKTYDVANM